jgi:cyclophilin family peptidyl-prolyl cis-trans isomerase
MDISIGNEPAGRLIIELFSEIVPKTCENVKRLCSGESGVSEHNELERYNLHYKGHLFHRIVPNGWIQGGGKSRVLTCLEEKIGKWRKITGILLILGSGNC